MFENGLQYVRADFHLHTCKDKEFVYSGEQNSFVNNYVSKLKLANINVGIITNHNKFDKDEYNAIRRAAKKQDIFILPGVELTIKEGANGIHTLIVFNPEEWLATVYKGNIIKNLIMDCQSYTKYRPNETTGGIFVSWRRKEELPTGA